MAEYYVRASMGSDGTIDFFISADYDTYTPA